MVLPTFAREVLREYRIHNGLVQIPSCQSFQDEPSHKEGTETPIRFLELQSHHLLSALMLSGFHPENSVYRSGFQMDTVYYSSLRRFASLERPKSTCFWMARSTRLLDGIAGCRPRRFCTAFFTGLSGTKEKNTIYLLANR